MKERDKIQIQCLKGKNPYIQVAHSDILGMVYLVKTVDDDHHLYNLPPEIQNIVLDWVAWNFFPAQKLYPYRTSYGLKHVLQKRTQIYLYNNQFKEAMLMNGFWPRDPSELNWVFYIQASSPAIKDQADGYPGTPIIGRQDLDRGKRKWC